MNNRIYRNIDADGLRHCNETCTQAVYHGDKLLSEMLTSMMNRIAALEGGSGSGSSGDTPSGGGTSATTNWSGMYFSINGDSISTYKGSYMVAGNKTKYEDGKIGGITDANLVLTSVDQTWWKKLVDGVGGNVLVNAAYSGASVSGYASAEDIREDNVTYVTSTYHGKCACSPLKIANLSKNGTAPDVIVTLIGANDWGNNAPLGSWNGSTTLVEPANTVSKTDFSTAVGLMLKRMKSAYPNARLLMCTSPVLYISGYAIDSATGLCKNGLGLTIADYNTRVKQICANQNVGLLDLYNCGITTQNWSEYLGVGVIGKDNDTVHPNKAGHALMGAKAVDDIKKL